MQICPKPKYLEIIFLIDKGRIRPKGSFEIGKLSIKLGGPQPINEILQ
jgi:hypothetical protein